MVLNRFSLIAAALTLGTLASTLASAQDIKPRLIRFGYLQAEATNQGRAANYLAEQVEKLSGGKMKLQTVGGGALGSYLQQQQAVIDGKQEMMVSSTTALAGVSKEMALWDTPFLFTSTEEADAVLDGPVGQKVMSKLPAKGLVGLVYWENGFRNTTNNQKPIETTEDFIGAKLRVMPNPIYTETFKILGANPVPLEFSELYAALKVGKVDGQENPYTLILTSKFYEVQKYITATNHVYSPWIVLINKKYWDGLSKDEQKVLMDAAKASRDFERKDTREVSKKALAELRAKGMQFSKFAPKETGRLRDKLTRVNASIAAHVGVDLWDETQVELTKIRKRGPPAVQ